MGEILETAEVRPRGEEEQTAALEQRPVELLQRLLRFDTSNPPGDEGACITWIQGLLEGLGCEVRLLTDSSGRPNLISRSLLERFH